MKLVRRCAPLVVLAALVACGSSSGGSPGGSSDGGSGGNGMAQLGASCVTDSEKQASFDGFSTSEVAIESNAACGGGGCLVYHFQGRASCPYGQSAQGMAPSGASACTVPDTSTPVTGAVLPQCNDRRAADTVYCSCQCADSSGNAGAGNCTCPSSYTCVSLGDPLGSYCIKVGTVYDATTACATTCDPQASPCK